MEKQPGPKPRLNVFGYLDETGLLQTPVTDKIFGLGILTSSHPSELHRHIVDYRNKKQFYEEFKFHNISQQNLPIYKGLVDIFFNCHNLKFSCVMHDKQKINIAGNYNGNCDRAYNSLVASLVSKVIDTSEYIAILADDVSTKKDNNFEKQIREKIKRKCRRNALFGISRLESHALGEIQMVDVLLGTVAYAFKIKYNLINKNKHSAKYKLVKHLRDKLDVAGVASDLNRKMKYGVKFEIEENK